MIDINSALKLMQDSVDSIQRSGMITESIVVSSDMVILGKGSFLDSLGFVTFISDLEERVSAVAGKDHYLVLSDIHDANADQAFLSAGALAAYIEKITE
jgi:acyl carrier protein